MIALSMPDRPAAADDDAAMLANVAWWTLTGPHARFATGRAGARRYRGGFAPIVGFADPQRPEFGALWADCAPGERLFCDGWSGATPAGWRIEGESTLLKMVWEGPWPALPADIVPLARLGAVHMPMATRLAALTGLGPFGPRGIELGEMLGVFDGVQLVAMAGERMQAHGLREISGVCTHPAHRGRGHARRLVHALMRQQLRRRQTPFVHVRSDNVAARRLYAQMGFRERCESVARVITRL